MKTASLRACLSCTLSLSLLALPLHGKDAPPPGLPEDVAAKLAAAEPLPELLKVIDESLEAYLDLAPPLASYAVSLRQNTPGAIQAILHRVLAINKCRQTTGIAVAAVGALVGSGEGMEEKVTEAVSAVVEACPDQADAVLLALTEAVPDPLKPVETSGKQGKNPVDALTVADPDSFKAVDWLTVADPDALKAVILAAVKQGLRRARIGRLAIPGSALRGTANPTNITGGEVSRSRP